MSYEFINHVPCDFDFCCSVIVAFMWISFLDVATFLLPRVAELQALDAPWKSGASYLHSSYIVHRVA